MKRNCVGVGRCYYRPYLYVVKVWRRHQVEGHTMADPMPDFVTDDSGETKRFTKDAASELVAQFKAKGHEADLYTDLRDEVNIFGGAAANDTVRVNDTGYYTPLAL